tara:strand:- start:277 stop:2217 length:1941 start_codon:yes stop_codon:yes gene_type:complete
LQLPPETGAFQRDFSLDYGPHLYGIFAALDDQDVEEVYCMKAAQVLWTTCLLAYIFKRVARDPGVILGMFASDGAAKKFSLSKMTPVGKATREVADRIDFSPSRKKGNTIQRKEYDGGFLELFGSNAASNVKSTTAHFVFVEEPDDANENVGNQGDSIKLLFERTKRVRRPKKVLGGTPSVKGFSRVAEHIELSDKRVLPVKCHECDQKHVLDFDYLSGWEADPDAKGEKHPIYGYHRPDNAVYACPHCGSAWDDYQRKENIRTTVAEAIADGDPLCGWEPTVPGRRIAGFTRLSELYSCLPGAGHTSLVRDYLEAEHYARLGDVTKKIVFINSKRGEPYEYQDGRDDADTLREMAEADTESQRAEKVCPEEGYLVTIGVDVQDNRLALVVRAHGRGRRSWLMFADEIWAKAGTMNTEDPVWQELDRVVFSPFEREGGGSIYASGITIDSGGHSTDAVYEWVISRQKRYPSVKIMAGKGSSSQTDPPVFMHPPVGKALTHKNPNRRTKADNKGVRLYIVGTNKAKDYLADQMSLNSRGEGRFHYYAKSQMRHDYFDQMLAESKIPGRSGRQTWKQKSGCPCEFWDCEVYAEHAARAMRVHLMRSDEWDDLEIKVKQSDLFSAAQPLEPEASDEVEQPGRRKSNYWS